MRSRAIAAADFSDAFAASSFLFLPFPPGPEARSKPVSLADRGVPQLLVVGVHAIAVAAGAPLHRRQERLKVGAHQTFNDR